MQIAKSEIRATFINERERLLSLIATLTDADLNAPSLCKGWAVRDVLSHIIGFEVSLLDVAKLVLGIKDLDQINNEQTLRYKNTSKQDFIALLNKGQKRILFGLSLIPSFIFNLKLIKIKNGKVSLAQIYGDGIADRAIHYIDIANPLRGESFIKNILSIDIILRFMFSCIHMLGPKLPKAAKGKLICIETSKPAKIIYWNVGTNHIGSESNQKPDLYITSSANDFIFLVTGRPKLIKNNVILKGDSILAKNLKATLNSNAFWE